MYGIELFSIRPNGRST